MDVHGMNRLLTMLLREAIGIYGSGLMPMVVQGLDVCVLHGALCLCFVQSSKIFHFPIFKSTIEKDKTAATIVYVYKILVSSESTQLA
jgi:hypothetical protein